MGSRERNRDVGSGGRNRDVGVFIGWGKEREATGLEGLERKKLERGKGLKEKTGVRGPF